MVFLHLQINTCVFICGRTGWRGRQEGERQTDCVIDARCVLSLTNSFMKESESSHERMSSETGKTLETKRNDLKICIIVAVTKIFLFRIF